MSKEVDLQEPVSEEDEAYVRSRPWLLEDARLAGITVVFESDPDGAGFDDEAEEESEEGESIDYSTWIKKDLFAEIDRRNDERDEDDLIDPASDKNDDLIAALVADDEALASAEDAD